MNIDIIIIMFGCGNITHWIVSIIEEKVFLRNELKLSINNSADISK